ncbi:MAG TPA: A/G-specific adenine glycosylase [Stellaceae bacterium]|nr:A/G-specific adenine glycosylase [Stellaceae bacterium]
MPPLPRPDRSPAASSDRALRLLAWYDRHRRVLPWRAPPGERPDAYRVWLSEIMLQQTTVVAVGPYFERFLERWPRVEALAAASLDEVLHAWQGLGYYARARNLHACARSLVAEHGGAFPTTEAELRALPGIGAYTAAAIAAIAFDRPAMPVDGNIERVVARLFAVREVLPNAKPRLRELAASLLPERRQGDFAQAAMDLGATICTPKKPKCVLCPWREDCAARRAGIAESLPLRTPKRAKPMRRGVAFWIEDKSGAVLLRRRPAKGLLGGMIEVPSTEWRGKAWEIEEAKKAAPLPAARWTLLSGVVRHSFTHFDLELQVLAGKATRAPSDLLWVLPQALQTQALPTVMKKVIAFASMARLPRGPASGTIMTTSKNGEETR